MGDTVSIRREGAVSIVTIERPEVRNAVDAPTAAQLSRAFAEFDRDDDAFVAVLTGSSATFCAGADLSAISDGRGNSVLDDVTADGPMGPTRMDLSKPVIAAIEGFAVAGGLELALWCDLRVAASDAVLGVYCRRWGVPLVDGGTVRLPRLIGHGRAMDLILTGRGVPAPEALSMGLVDRVTEPGVALDAAVECAQHLAGLPQRCLRSDRRSLLEQWSLDHDAAMANETRLGPRPSVRARRSWERPASPAGEGRHGRPA